MDERSNPRVFLAGWIWSFQRQLVKYRVRDPIHPEPGGASPKEGFDEEFQAILAKHGIEYDPKYLFG
jgi:hypothetical protein